LEFRLYPLRYSFVARDAIYFPPGKSGNILRGAFGVILRKMVCIPDCPGVAECPRRADCFYARMFEPAALSPGPSGLGDWPRPFVFRAMHLDGRTIEPGEQFFFDLNLFEMRQPAMERLAVAFAELGRVGIGPGRGRAELSAAVVLPHGGDSESEPLRIDLSHATDASHLCIRFVTPTELKFGGVVFERPDFGALASRIRDRLSTLRELYDSGPLEIDFRAFGERASKVRMTRCAVEHVPVSRRSSRTGQEHPIGGFVGEAEYEGDLGEFVPYLFAAKWTGVGRQTVWGKGEIAIL
jgi:hypothetical protein